MTIYIGADHHGFALKSSILKYLKKAGYAAFDAGAEKLDPEDDFPVFAARVVNKMRASSDNDARGILICGSGQGMCMAANRFRGIRAVLGYDRESVRSSRNDDDSNILCLPADTLDKHEVNVLVETWINTAFAGAPRFMRRIKEMDDLV